MAFNLANLAATGVAALPGTLVKGVRKGALPADFQSVLATNLAAQLHNGVPLLSTRTTLQRALTGALAPPGTSPPHQSTASPPAQTKLAALINNAGQQNEIPGTILDADPAKEPPAPQKKPTHPEPLPDAAAAFARSIVAQASTSASSPVASTAAAAPPAADSSRQQQPPGLTAVPHVADQFSFAPSNVSAPVSPPQTAGSDVLTRIVARALNAGAQHAAPPAPTETKSSVTVTTPAAAFEKLAAAIAASADAGSQSQTQSRDGETQPQSHDTQPSIGIGGAAQSPTSLPTLSAMPKTAMAYTPVDVNAVIEQVIKGIIINTAGSSSQIRLRLQPEHLGEVAVKLTVSGNSISANVVAQNASVRDALLGAQPQLSRSLADAGLSLGGFSVNVSGGNAGTADERRQTQQNSAGFKIGGWDAAFSPNDDQQGIDVVNGPAASGPRAMVINSLA